MAAIALLREQGGVGFPEMAMSDRRDVPGGWVHESKAALASLVTSMGRKARKPRVVLELGVFMGATTHELRRTLPDATLICVDVWRNEFLTTLGTQYSSTVGPFHAILKEKDLWHTFASHFRGDAHVVPMRMMTRDAFPLLERCGVVPDLVIIDADNSYEGASLDISTVLRLWPRATVLGMLFDKAGVRRAVRETRRPAYVESTVTDRCCAWSFTQTDVLCTDTRDVKMSWKSMMAAALRRDDVDAFCSARRRGTEVDHEWLMRAAQFGSVKILRFLISEDGARVHVRRKKSGNTALIQAAYYGQDAAMHALALLGADFSVKNKWGESADDMVAKKLAATA